jgi:hypothetical protein
MGSESFVHQVKGKNAQEAFNNAREEAAYDHGHSGYTGTIAEKHGFIIIPRPDNGLNATAAAWEMIDTNPSISDKWGPAGCFEIGDEDFLFFGLASS